MFLVNWLEWQKMLFNTKKRKGATQMAQKRGAKKAKPAKSKADREAENLTMRATRFADNGEAILLAGSHQVQGALVDKQVRPPLALDGGDLLPGLALVAGAKHDRGVLGAARPEVVVRGDMVAARQHGDAGGADILLGAGRAVVDDHPRNLGVVRLHPHLRPGVLRRQNNNGQGQDRHQEPD